MTTSVVIATHNRCQSLAKTLESLRLMDCPAGLSWEVCVVDNNCSDETPAVVAEYARKMAPVPVRHIRESRPGVAWARNAGVSAATGDVIAFVDDDVLVGSSWLPIIHRAFENDPALAILGGKLEPNPESAMPKWLAGLNTAPLGLIDYGAQRIEVRFPYLATANCAFRKSAIVDAGMFNARLGRQPQKLYSDEDTEMVARIQAKGGKTVYEPAISARHFVPNSRMTKAYFRRWYREKGEGVGLVGDTSTRSLMGIAYFEYRSALVSLARWARDLVTLRSTFQQQLHLGYFAGILTGRVKALRRHNGAQ